MFSPESKPWWPSKEELRKAVDAFSQSCGFAIQTNGSAYRCSLAAHTTARIIQLKKKRKDTTPSRTRQRTSTRCGCGFFINFTKIIENWKTKWAPDEEECSPGEAVRVTKCDFYHSNGCFPSRNQLVVQKKAQGRYTSDLLTTEKLASIISFSRHGFIRAPMLRSMLKEMLPEGVPIDSQLVNNIRLKVNRVKKHQDENPESSKLPVKGPEDILLQDNPPLDGKFVAIIISSIRSVPPLLLTAVCRTSSRFHRSIK
jgi:hypothetical protein